MRSNKNLNDNNQIPGKNLSLNRKSMNAMIEKCRPHLMNNCHRSQLLILLYLKSNLKKVKDRQVFHNKLSNWTFPMRLSTFRRNNLKGNTLLETNSMQYFLNRIRFRNNQQNPNKIRLSLCSKSYFQKLFLKPLNKTKRVKQTKTS